jgi:signal transduction histidine kinase
MNGAAATLLSIDLEAARGEAIEAVFPEVAGLPRLLAECLDRGRPATREVLRARWPDGREGHFGVTLSPCPGVDDRPTGALMLMTDLTEIRQLQQQAQVRENLAAVGEVSAGIAHEIRNALGTILANARLVEKRDDPLAAGPARAIVREVESTAAVIEEFLTYARPAPPKPETFDLRVALARAAATAPDAIDVEIDGEFGPVHADATLVTRAFDNLFRNAGDVARESGKRLSVTARGRRVADGRSIQVEVEDDGPGIPDDDLDRVFTPFYTSRSRGTGLGLASVRRTLSDLGGAVEAARGSAGGALFRLRFPVAPGDPDGV